MRAIDLGSVHALLREYPDGSGTGIARTMLPRLVVVPSLAGEVGRYIATGELIEDNFRELPVLAVPFGGKMTP